MLKLRSATSGIAVTSAKPDAKAWAIRAGKVTSAPEADTAASSGRKAGEPRIFCGTCGARVLKEVTAAERWLISAGQVDGLTGKRIVKNLWEQSKPDWYDLPATVS